MRLALFDMDRTLVRKETASLWVRFQREEGLATTRDLLRTLGWVAQYTLGVLEADRVAEKVTAALEGQAEPEMVERCARWFPRWVEPHVSPIGAARVRAHLERGDVCAIVTGATRYAAEPLAARLGIPHVVASELEVVDGRFTGRVAKPLCIGAGKLSRASAFARATRLRLADAVFYTDSITDLPLLLAVGEAVAVNPDPRLGREARRRGFRTERW